MSRLCLALAAVVAAAAPSSAAAKGYDIPAAMGDQLPALLEQTPLPVLLPQRLPLDYDGRLYTSTDASDAGMWTVSLAAIEGCGGNACSFGAIYGERGAKRSNSIRVRLRGGRNGWFRPLSCGGSCAPPSIQFTREKVLYTIQAKVFQRGRSDKQVLVAAANSALAAGPR